MRSDRYVLSVAIAFAVAATATPVRAQVLQGPAEVADGDTISISGVRVRLFGIDAPELTQNCYEGTAAIACGELAKAQLQSMIGTSKVSCVQKSIDRYDRVVAVCRIGGIDLGQAIVEAGWATAFREYSDDYVIAETRARAIKLGIWRWSFQTPEDYRASQERRDQPVRQDPARRGSASSARQWEQNGQCLIKGNRNRRGQWIYHLPGMPYYEAAGAEEYFCTEAEAQHRATVVRACASQTSLESSVN